MDPRGIPRVTTNYLVLGVTVESFVRYVTIKAGSHAAEVAAKAMPPGGTSKDKTRQVRMPIKDKFKVLGMRDTQWARVGPSCETLRL